jgi:peptidoglycan/xylan/chitin deacetylase (PgdA/CDA1 family)
VLDGLVPGEIVLMHLGSARDRSTIDSHALPRIIRAVRARGYRFVTLAGIRAPRG